MVVAANGGFSGSVSGGCIEGAVIQSAIEVIDSGVPRTLEFGVTNEMAWEVGLACGGRVHLFVEPVVAEPAVAEPAVAEAAAAESVPATPAAQP